MTGQMRRFVHDLRTEGSGPGRDATAVGLGVFIGSLPFYGFHLAICLAAGTLLRLNRVKLYLAANISNPFMAPFLILSELQAGSLVRRGELRPLTIEAVKRINPWSLGADILIGAVIVGAVLGLAIGSATWMLTRDPGEDPLLRLARATGLGSVRRRQHHGVGVRARQAPRGSAVSDGPDGGSAAVGHVRGNARRCGMRVRPDACAAGRGRGVLARGSMAA